MLTIGLSIPYTLGMVELDFADRVNSVLKKANVTQQRLAELSGVSQPTISAAANGYDIRLSSYRKIEAALQRIESKKTR